MTKFQKRFLKNAMFRSFGHSSIEIYFGIYDLKFGIWVYNRMPLGTTTMPEAVTVNRLASSSRW